MYSQVNTFAFMHVPTIVDAGGGKMYLTLAMVERFREAAGDPAWVQEFDWNEDVFPFQASTYIS